MYADVIALWPDAPLVEVASSGRWLRFADADGDAIYLQRYAWDEQSHPNYLVVGQSRRGDAVKLVDQRRYPSLVEALDAVRSALAA